jgi:hypothetical protein
MDEREHIAALERRVAELEAIGPAPLAGAKGKRLTYRQPH